MAVRMMMLTARVTFDSRLHRRNTHRLTMLDNPTAADELQPQKRHENGDDHPVLQNYLKPQFIQFDELKATSFRRDYANSDFEFLICLMKVSISGVRLLTSGCMAFITASPRFLSRSGRYLKISVGGEVS